MKPRLWPWLVVLWIFGVTSASAGTRPVSIGLNANWDHWATRTTNVGWSRIDILWKDDEPQRGVFDWSITDSQVADCIANGQQILAILHQVPSWANGSTDVNMPPLTTVDWAEFVHQLAARYAGRIAAYEIWNEPDTGSSSPGIGWNRNVEEPPLYTDFVHAAAVEIRKYAPGTLVVGPAYKTYNDGSGSQADNRKRRFFQQMQAAVYPDGTGPSFLDVMSFHNNAKDTEPSKDMGRTLNTNNLSYLTNYLPSKAAAPVWVTEYGWRSNAVGEAGQREKECNETKIYTGLLEAAYTGLANYNISRSFIYVQFAEGSSAGIFYNLNTPKMVVTQYLQRLAYPATQSPALSADFPNCTGAAFATTSSSATVSNEAFAAWGALGLADPRAGLPAGFSASHGELSSGSQSVYFTFANPSGAVIRVSAGPALAGDPRQLGGNSAEWDHQGVHVRVGLVAGEVRAKDWVRALAKAIDLNFDHACLSEASTTDDKTVSSMGFLAPSAPTGFRLSEKRLDLTRPTAGCGQAKARSPRSWDFMWMFKAESGETLRAGIYRYGDGSLETIRTPASLHWSDAHGTRYWVGADAQNLTSALEDVLYELARSMDPSFRP